MVLLNPLPTLKAVLRCFSTYTNEMFGGNRQPTTYYQELFMVVDSQLP